MHCLLLCSPSEHEGGVLQELGFHVLELNAASERSGARLTADVGEALQSDCMPQKVALDWPACSALICPHTRKPCSVQCLP